MKTLRYEAASVPIADRYDVLVCGGGPGGFPAALAAARRGLSVLLIESDHQLGGTGTSGMVSHWLGGRLNDGEWAVGGVFRELTLRAAELGIAVVPDPSRWAEQTYQPHGIHKGQLAVGIPFDPFAMAPLIEQTLLDAGVEIRYETTAVDVIRDGRSLTHVITASKAGLSAIPASIMVDATGDADVAAFAGCRYEKGDSEGYLTPVSLIMHLEGVDEAELMRYVTSEDDPRFRKKLSELRAVNVDCFTYDIMIFVKLNRDGYFMINGRALEEVDGTDPVSRSRAYVTERRKIGPTLDLFRRYWPGCRDITLRAVASRLGVRETRRVSAIGYVSVQDVIDGRRFDDTIGFSTYGWDLGKRGTQPMHGVRKPSVIPIPFGILVPDALDNLICPGRAVHVERDVLGPLRVQAPIMAMGEAAGAAAAAAVRGRVPLASVEVTNLRRDLAAAGAIVDYGKE